MEDDTAIEEMTKRREVLLAQAKRNYEAATIRAAETARLRIDAGRFERLAGEYADALALLGE